MRLNSTCASTPCNHESLNTEPPSWLFSLEMFALPARSSCSRAPPLSVSLPSFELFVLRQSLSWCCKFPWFLSSQSEWDLLEISWLCWACKWLKKTPWNRLVSLTSWLNSRELEDAIMFDLWHGVHCLSSWLLEHNFGCGSWHQHMVCCFVF